MAGAFSDALDRLDAAFAAAVFDPAECRDAFHVVTKVLAPGVSGTDLHRMVPHCLTALGLGPDPAPVINDPSAARRQLWAAQECIETLLIDKEGRNRAYAQNGITRRLALGRKAGEWDRKVPIPLPHIPLETDDARALIAPFLADLEGRSKADPLAHIHLCWQVLEHPAPPFDTVFRSWLASLDAKRGTLDLVAIDRAMALATLAKEGQQRLSWPDCERELLPQLNDPHPLVAAAAGRYLGMLMEDPEEMIVFSTAPPLVEILEMIAVLPRNRRFAAGGFLNGFDAGMDGVFSELRDRTAGTDFDVDGWTLDVLADAGVEPYLPSAQAFWFYVHEGYCFDPAFVSRMIDAGHHWEAMMTATEMHQHVDGMQPVLERLVALDVEEVSSQSQRWLDVHYGDADTV